MISGPERELEMSPGKRRAGQQVDVKRCCFAFVEDFQIHSGYMGNRARKGSGCF